MSRRTRIVITVAALFVVAFALVQFTPLRWLKPVSSFEGALGYRLPQGTSLEEVQEYCEERGYDFGHYRLDRKPDLTGHNYLLGEVSFGVVSTGVYVTFYFSSDDRLRGIEVTRGTDSL